MRDKIVVTVEPPQPRERLDIAEAFKQVLDILELVEQAAGDEARFDWKLDSAATNSPFTVIAAAPGARHLTRSETLAVAQRRVQEGLADLSGGTIPSWMRKKQRGTARKITRRYRDGIGRVTLKTDERAKRQFLFNGAMAAQALQTLEKVDGIESVIVPAHRSYGEIEGTLLEVSEYRGQPALLIRTNGYDVVRCIVDKHKLEEIGQSADLRSVWQHSRVRMVGSLWFQEGGMLDRITVDEMGLFPPVAVSLKDVMDPEFTAGLEPSEYLNKLENGGFH